MLLSLQACTQAFQTSPGTVTSALLMLKSSSPAPLSVILSLHPLPAKQPLPQSTLITLLLCLKATLRGWQQPSHSITRNRAPAELTSMDSNTFLCREQKETGMAMLAFLGKLRGLGLLKPRPLAQAKYL